MRAAVDDRIWTTSTAAAAPASERERARDLKRSGSAWLPQRALSGHLTTLSSHTNTKTNSFITPSSPSGSNGNSNARGGEGDYGNTEKVKGYRWIFGSNEEDCGGGGGGSDDGEDGCSVRPPAATTTAATTTSSLGSRKRVKLRGKVPGDCNVMDPPVVVPRRLRSAINKRSSQSASPPVPDSSRKQFLVPNGTQDSNTRGSRIFKLYMPLDPATSDEKEVADTLTCLLPHCARVKANEVRRIIGENSEAKATSNSLLEASKKEGTNSLLPCIGEARNPSSIAEKPCKEILKVEPSARDQCVAASATQMFDVQANGPSQPQSQISLLSHPNEQAHNMASSEDALNSSNPLGTPLRISQPTQLDALSIRQTDVGLSPARSASVEYKMLTAKHKSDSSSNYTCQEEAIPDVRSDSSSSPHGHLMMFSSKKVAACLDSAAAMGRHTSTRNDLQTAKLLPATTERKQPRNRCSTHVYISHLIQNYQSTEKKQEPLLPANQPKAKNGTNFSLHSSNGAIAGFQNGMLPSLPNGSHVERNMHEARARMLQDARLLQTQHAYSQQNQVVDLTSLPAAGATEAGILGNGPKSFLRPNAPYLHSQVPHNSVMPFPFPRTSTSYTDQLPAPATQQVQQLQIPHYIGNSPFYNGPHMSAAATKQQQQQQLWQIHMAQYRPLLGWQQNGRQQQHHHHQEDNSSSSSLSPVFPILAPSSKMPNGGAYRVSYKSQQQPLLPIPAPSSSSSRAKHTNGSGGFSPEQPSKVQLLCNAQQR